jgi:hypothetical protein
MDRVDDGQQFGLRVHKVDLDIRKENNKRTKKD